MAEAVSQLQVSQPWIEIENSPVTIDLELFQARQPLADLLFEGSEESKLVASLSQALADFAHRWPISPQLHDRASAADAEALLVIGGDAEVLVWREGMVIGAGEPLATALMLLVADFSATARHSYVYAKPQLLRSALGLLPDDVKSRYVPGADDFIEQARHEMVMERQQILKSRAPKLNLRRKQPLEETPGC